MLFKVLFGRKYCPKTATTPTAFPSVQVISMVASMSMAAGVSPCMDNIMEMHQKCCIICPLCPLWEGIEQFLLSFKGISTPTVQKYWTDQFLGKLKRGWRGSRLWTVFTPKSDKKAKIFYKIKKKKHIQLYIMMYS